MFVTDLNVIEWLPLKSELLMSIFDSDEEYLGF